MLSRLYHTGRERSIRVEGKGKSPSPRCWDESHFQEATLSNTDWVKF